MLHLLSVTIGKKLNPRWQLKDFTTFDSKGNKPYIILDSNTPYIILDDNKPYIILDNNKPYIIIDSNKPYIILDSNKPYIILDFNKPYIILDSNKQYIILDSNKPYIILDSNNFTLKNVQVLCRVSKSYKAWTLKKSLDSHYIITWVYTLDNLII